MGTKESDLPLVGAAQPEDELKNAVHQAEETNAVMRQTESLRRQERNFYSNRGDDGDLHLAA